MWRQFSVLWRSSWEVLVTTLYSSVWWEGFWERIKLKNKIVLQLVRVWQYSRVSPHSAERLYLFFFQRQCPFHTETYSHAEDLQILSYSSNGVLATEEGWVHPLYWWTNWKFWMFLLPNFMFPYKWNTRASKRHRLSFKGCFRLSSNVKQFRVWKFSVGLCDKLSLQPAGTFFSKAANTVKFFNLQKLHFVFNFSLLCYSMTPVLLWISITYNLVRPSSLLKHFDQTISVLFSCAYKYLNLPSPIVFKMNQNARFTLTMKLISLRHDRVLLSFVMG